MHFSMGRSVGITWYYLKDLITLINALLNGPILQVIPKDFGISNLQGHLRLYKNDI
jgi:hypothetical protein